eukprot:12077819-Heterocapsa_arctica.AAC.1
MQRARGRRRLRPRVANRRLTSTLCLSSGAVLHHHWTVGGPLRALQRHGSGVRDGPSPNDNMPLNKGRCRLRLDRAQHRGRMNSLIGRRGRPHRLLRQAGR